MRKSQIAMKIIQGGACFSLHSSVTKMSSEMSAKHFNAFLKFQVDSFLHILTEACGPEVEDYFSDSKFERLQIHCALASYYLSRASMAKETSEKTELLKKATSHLNTAVPIDIDEQLPVLGLGQIAQAKVMHEGMHLIES